MKVQCTQRVTHTCFGHSCGNLQGGTFQWIDTLKMVCRTGYIKAPLLEW
jgi:hypothetical protein